MTYLSFAPVGFSSFRHALPLWLKEKLFQKHLLSVELATLFPDIDWASRLFFSGHHLSHAASAFYPSPFDRHAEAHGSRRVDSGRHRRSGAQAGALHCERNRRAQSVSRGRCRTQLCRERQAATRQTRSVASWARRSRRLPSATAICARKTRTRISSRITRAALSSIERECQPVLLEGSQDGLCGYSIGFPAGG